jgi:hypothetical protein
MRIFWLQAHGIVFVQSRAFNHLTMCCSYFIQYFCQNNVASMVVTLYFDLPGRPTLWFESDG